MKNKAVSGIMLTLLSIGLVTLGFSAQIVDANSFESPGIEWIRTYKGACMRSVVETSDGGYALAIDAWLVKIDPSGNIEWNQTSGEGRGYAVIQTSDGGYAMAGYTPFTNRRDAWLIKTDSAGNLQWSKKYEKTDYNYVFSIVETSDGGYALAGYIRGSGFFDADVWLVKTDSTGDVQWSKTYGVDFEDPDDFAFNVVQTIDGGYTIAGYSHEGGARLIKTDSAGDIQWDQSYGQRGFWSVVQTSDGGYAAAGTIWPRFDFWLVKTDTSGNMEWNKTYGGVGWDYARSVVQTRDGGYALAGDTSPFFQSPGNSWLMVKTDSTGNMQWNKTLCSGSWASPSSLIQTSDGGYAIAGHTNYHSRLAKLAEPEVIVAIVNIDPDTLNLGSEGQWITAYIQLPEEYNAEDIDAATILLNGTISPILDPIYDFVTNSSEYLVDHNEDRILERMVKFDQAEVVALLGVGEATLTITGEVDGTKFEGSDSIRVISPSSMVRAGPGGRKGLKR